jgi:hypothetical protein
MSGTPRVHVPDGRDQLKPTGTQAIERAVAVLCCFERFAQLGASEIARETSVANELSAAIPPAASRWQRTT